MDHWCIGLLRIAFAFVIAVLAGLISISVGAIFCSQSNPVIGITFLATVAICSFLNSMPGLSDLPSTQPVQTGMATF